MNISRETLVTLLGNMFPENLMTTTSSEVVVRFDEPELIGVSLKSMHLLLNAEEQFSGLNIKAAYNGEPVSFDESIMDELELNESRLKIYDLPVDSARSLKKVIRQYYC